MAEGVAADFMAGLGRRLQVLDLEGDRVVREGDEATPVGRPGRELTPPSAAPCGAGPRRSTT